MNRIVLLLASIAIGTAAPGLAAGSEDLAAVQQVLRQFAETQDSGDMESQSRLMIPERVWIGTNGARRTDNVQNMRVQQAEALLLQEEVPGLQRFTVDRDIVIRFHGGGNVAIASFYRTAVVLFPPGTPQDRREEYGGYNVTGTVVLEKRGNEWKIVHTHWSATD